MNEDRIRKAFEERATVNVVLRGHPAIEARYETFKAGYLAVYHKVTEGWTFARANIKPFRCIDITAPDGSRFRVCQHARGEERLLYMLAEALMLERDRL